jgi:hypothetical protein
MDNYPGLLAQFGINEDLKEQFSNFETEWGTKNKPIKPYSIITIVKNEDKPENVSSEVAKNA